MSCCGVSVQAQRLSAASYQGLTRLTQITANPNEAGPNWRSDWGSVKVLFNGQRVSANTFSAAHSSGYIDLYAFSLKTGQIAVNDGEPVVQRHKGHVEIYGPSGYTLDIQAREQAKASQWWPKT